AIALVAQEKSKDRRRALYFVIGKIGTKTHHTRCASFLVERLTIEKDKYVLHGMLNSFAEIPKASNVNLGPIYDRLNDRQGLVRYAAISALSRSKDPAAEGHLLAVLSNASEPGDLANAAGMLGGLGSRRSIPALQKLALHRTSDV